MAAAIRPLFKSGDNADHAQVLRACEQARQRGSEDVETAQIQAIALLKLDRFEEAVNLFEQHGSALQSSATLPYAYAMYKTHRLEQAREVAATLSLRGAQHLQAQAAYRLEDFAHARQLYEKLAPAAGDEANDLRINALATDAQLEATRQGELVGKRKASKEDLDEFETAYNAACGCIGRGELLQASVLLQRAYDLCKAIPDMGEADQQSELLSIQVQQLYVLVARGKLDQAEALAAQIETAKIIEPSTRYVSEINKIPATTSPLNPFLAYRRLHAAVTPDAEDPLFGSQKMLAHSNQVAAELTSLKFPGVLRNSSKFLHDRPSPTLDVETNTTSVAHAAATAQMALGKAALKKLLPLHDKHPTDVGLLATIVQMYMLTTNYGAAITLMETFFRRLEESQTDEHLDIRFAPGLVATFVSLCAAEGRKSYISTELARAASHWRHRSKHPQLLRVAALSLLKSPIPAHKTQARELFEALTSRDAGDSFATAGLLATDARKGSEATSRANASLSQVETLCKGVNVAALEEQGIPQPPTAITAMLKRKAGGHNGKPAKKRIRKSRRPKDAGAADKPPDPERWMPLRDRSTWRPKGKKGKQKQAALTQGGFNTPKDRGVSPAPANQASAAASAPASAPVKGSGGGEGAKAKKKGKKR